MMLAPVAAVVVFVVIGMSAGLPPLISDAALT